MKLFKLVTTLGIVTSSLAASGSIAAGKDIVDTVRIMVNVTDQNGDGDRKS